MREWLMHFKSFDNYIEYFCFDNIFAVKKDNEYKVINILNLEILSDNIEELKKVKIRYLKKEQLAQVLNNVKNLIVKRSKVIEKIIDRREEV